MLKNAQSVLDAAERDLAKVRALYQGSLTAKEASGELQTTIKHVVEDQRSALDYVATAINEKFGKPGERVYFPYGADPGKFKDFFDRNFPKLAAAQPAIFAAFERHQPYQAGHEWIAQLIALTNENKHRELTPQTRTETVVKKHGGVSWKPVSVRFGGGVWINGVPVDPVTQEPAGTQTIIYVDWLFRQPQVSALATLEAVQTGIRPALEDICKSAGL